MLSFNSLTITAQLNVNQDTDLKDPVKAYNLIGTLISNMIGLAIVAAAITAFIFIIIGAIQWGTAANGDGKAKARKTILYAAVGLIMISCVYVFIYIFNNILPQANG